MMLYSNFRGRIRFSNAGLATIKFYITSESQYLFSAILFSHLHVPLSVLLNKESKSYYKNSLHSYIIIITLIRLIFAENSNKEFYLYTQGQIEINHTKFIRTARIVLILFDINFIPYETTEIKVTTEKLAKTLACAEVGTAEVGTAEVGTAEVGTAEVGTAEVGTAEVEPHWPGKEILHLLKAVLQTSTLAPPLKLVRQHPILSLRAFNADLQPELHSVVLKQLVVT